MNLIFTKYHIIISSKNQTNSYWQEKFYYFINSLEFENENEITEFLLEKYLQTAEDWSKTRIKKEWKSNLDYNYGFFEFKSCQIRFRFWIDGFIERLERLVLWSDTGHYVLSEKNNQLLLHIHLSKGMGEMSGVVKLSTEEKENFFKMGDNFINQLVNKMYDEW